MWQVQYSRILNIILYKKHSNLIVKFLMHNLEHVVTGYNKRSRIYSCLIKKTMSQTVYKK